MKVTVDSKYFVFPINTAKEQGRLKFLCDNELVYALFLKYDAEAPDFYAYVDMSPFLGKELSLEYPDTDTLCFRKASCVDIPDLYTETRRPKVHFTARSGWVNDPNGLYYKDGLYHMFFQYNPTEPAWNNMHWQHAVSSDLIHWRELDTALYPDELGEMFSGSAFVDRENRSGLGKDADAPVLIYYTACGARNLSMDGTRHSTQCLAYSNDNCKTLTKLSENPIVPAMAPQNRDPKVVYCEELSCYLMGLYTEEHSKGDYSILRSDDLIHWERFYDYRLEGEWEFPDILKFKGSDGKTKYVFTSNTDCYAVHEIRDGRIVRIQEPRKPWHADFNHSPLSFDSIPDGRCIRAIWENFEKPLFFGKNAIRGQLITLEYTLEEKDGVYYLASNPVRELESLYKNRNLYKDILLSDTHEIFNHKACPVLISLKGELGSGALTVSFFGKSLLVDFDENKVTYLENPEKSCPLNVAGAELNLKILVDECGIEVFSDGGKSCMYNVDAEPYIDTERSLCTLSVSGECKISELEIVELGSIWEDVTDNR